MKALAKCLAISMVAMVMVCFYSCEKAGEAGKGQAAFSLSIDIESGLKSDGILNDTVTSWHLMVSVEDMEGNPVVTDALIPLYVFGTGFLSENLDLEAGEYNLVKFLVINPAGEVIYATPVEGSPMAYLVNDPLPVYFRIFAGRVTTVRPEVLQVGDQPPEQFGYVNFGMQIVRPLDFYVICYLDTPVDSSSIHPTTARLTVFGPDNWHYTFRLESKVNHLAVRGGARVYLFLLEKEGFRSQKMEFRAAQLKATTYDDPLVLKIPGDSSQFRVLVLQPGPEKGKDAMITNLEPDKNFGDYKYFEATYLTEPILTVMRSNRSLIWFDLNELPESARIRKVTLQLFYEVPVAWDDMVTLYDTVTASDTWYGGVLQQIIAPWEEDKVTWNNAPAVTTVNQVYIPPFIRNVNFIIVDVTRLFVPVNSVSVANYGMLFRLYPTEKYPGGFRFASSDYPVAGMRPKLRICYTLN